MYSDGRISEFLRRATAVMGWKDFKILAVDVIFNENWGGFQHPEIETVVLLLIAWIAWDFNLL